jgi:excisionase family DNA binding protein
MTDEPKRYLKANEAAKYLGVSESTMVRLRLSGEGPYFYRFPGGAIRYATDDLDAYMASLKVITHLPTFLASMEDENERQDQLQSEAASKGAD